MPKMDQLPSVRELDEIETMIKPEVSRSSAKRPVASVLERTVPYRPGLSGHTVTVERRYDSDRVVLARRANGELAQIYALPAQWYVTFEGVGRAIAAQHGAVFVDLGEAARAEQEATAVLRIAEISVMAGVSQETAGRWIREGTLTNVAASGRPRVLTVQVQALLGDRARAVQPETDPLVSPDKALEILGVGRAALREWTTSGRLPSIRTAGGHFRYLTSDVHALRKATLRADSRRARVELYTVAEVAVLCAASPHAVREWVSDGVLATTTRHRGHLRFRAAVIHDLLGISDGENTDPLLHPYQAARILDVDTSTVRKYRVGGKLAAVRLPGGYHRYRTSAVKALRAGQDAARAARENS